MRVAPSGQSPLREGDSGGGGELIDEADEMIWWEWDGKIVGFSEW